MERDIHIRRSFGPHDRGSHVCLPFDVAEATDSLGVEYRYARVRLLDGAGRVAEWKAPFDGEFRAPFPTHSDARFHRLELWCRHPAAVDMLAAPTNLVYVE